MSIGKVFRSGIWLFMGTSVSSVLSYGFWIVMSLYVSPDVIGTAAIIIALQSLLLMMFSFGLPAGLQRFVGRDAAANDKRSISIYFSTSVLFLIGANVPLVSFLVVLSTSSIDFILPSSHLIFVAILLLFSFWNPLFNSLFISTLKTEVSAFAHVIAAVTMIGTGILLVSLGYALLGIVAALAISSLSLGSILLVCAARYFKKNTVFTFDKSRFKELFKAGSAAWIPRLLTTIGESAGILLLFGFMGSSETGLYFIAFAIGSIVYSLPTSILGVMFPYLSGLGEGKEDAIRRAIRLSTAITTPICLVIGFYPEIPFMFLGNSYVEAAPMLRILVMGAVFVPIVSGYVSYIYASGIYKDVAVIGSVSNIIRVFLYYFLISYISGTGAAIAYSIGQIIAVSVSIISAHRIRFRLDWGILMKSLFLPALVGGLFFILRFPWFLGAPLLLLLCAVIYGRTRAVVRSDVLELAQAFLSQKHIEKIYVYAKPVINFLFKDE